MTAPTQATYTIDWGDGSAAETGVKLAGGASVIEKLHVYTQRGTYTVKVTNEQSSKSAQRTVTVEDPTATPEFSVQATGQPREAKVTITYPV